MCKINVLILITDPHPWVEGWVEGSIPTVIGLVSTLTHLDACKEIGWDFVLDHCLRYWIESCFRLTLHLFIPFCISIVTIHFFINPADGNQLSGFLPTQLGLLTSLEYLGLSTYVLGLCISSSLLLFAICRSHSIQFFLNHGICGKLESTMTSFIQNICCRF
jgi:hypothetical protein